MNRNPKGCSNIGGAVAFNMEYCRSAAMHFFSLYGYRPFSPAEFQLVEEVWSKLAPSRARRLIPLMSPLGEPCVLRGDLTLSAVAYAGSYHTRSEMPLRLSYADRVFAVPSPPKYNIEENQIGVELIGCEEGGADAETAALMLRTLDLLGIENSALVIGDVSVLEKIFEELPQEFTKELVDALSERSYTKYGELLGSMELSYERARLLKILPSLKGDLSVLGEASSFFAELGFHEICEEMSPLKSLCGTLAKLGYSERLRIDLGFVRDLGYYSGPLYNAYSLAGGALLGGGGRYDGLLAREGVAGQAAGFALNLKELADHCTPSAPKPAVMLWGGSCSSSEALRYVDALSKKNAAFELSWSASAQESLSTAKLRGYRWWVDLGGRRAVRFPQEDEISLKDFEEEALSC